VGGKSVVSCTKLCRILYKCVFGYMPDTCPIQTRFKRADTCGCSWIHASKHLIRSGYKLFPASIRTVGCGLDTIGYDRIHVPRFFRTVIVLQSFRVQTILEIFKDKSVSNMYLTCISHASSVSDMYQVVEFLGHVSAMYRAVSEVLLYQETRCKFKNGGCII